MTKPQIITATENVFNQLAENCMAVDNFTFFLKVDEKWSVAEHLQHLTISTKTTNLAFSLPLFIVRWVGGKPNRPSSSFETVKKKYFDKLESGAKARGRYIPKAVKPNKNKEQFVHAFTSAAKSFLTNLDKKRTESDLDTYLVKHPLLGRITLRELGYFTIFHTQHHLHSIQKLSMNV